MCSQSTLSHTPCIPNSCASADGKQQKKKEAVRPLSDREVISNEFVFFFISPRPSSSSHWAVSRSSCILLVENHRITKGCWRLVSTSFYSPATGADESQNYITRLALAQGTSDGNRGPSPSFRVTHWIWQTPNMVRQREFLRNMRDTMTVKKQHAVGRRLWH